MDTLDFYSPALIAQPDTGKIEFEFKSLPDAIICQKALFGLGMCVTWHPIYEAFQETHSFSATTANVKALYTKHQKELVVFEAKPQVIPSLVIGRDDNGLECVPS